MALTVRRQFKDYAGHKPIIEMPLVISRPRSHRMQASPTKNSPESIGFLTVLNIEESGWIGGYLLLNLAGRPLEFCCTAPVQPDRAQEVLYGPTLIPFLVGEHIAPAILQQTKLAPTITVTNVSEALAARGTIDQPVLYLVDEEEEANKATQDGIFLLDDYTLQHHHKHSPDRQIAEEVWQSAHEQFGLIEPFDRIHDAIAEAQRAAA